jgi:hypothetical protein
MQGKFTIIALLFITYPHSWCRSSNSETVKAAEGQYVTQTNNSKFAVVGYLPEWRYSGVDWEAISDHLTHLIFFSIEVDKQASFAAMDRFDDDQFIRFANLDEPSSLLI